jgi:hypothetical protein
VVGGGGEQAFVEGEGAEKIRASRSLGKKEKFSVFESPTLRL